MKIRKIRDSEQKAAAKLVGLNYSKLYEKRALREIKEMFKSSAIKPTYIVAEQKNKIIGLAGYIESWMDWNVYHIFWINVAPGHQGKGIGQALIKKIISIVRKKDVNLILLTSDIPNYYKKLGFKSLQKFRKKNYLMSLKLK
jgi:predicted N-acetyltransferase YhbS